MAVVLVCVAALCVGAGRARGDETVFACGSAEPDLVFYESDAVGMEETQSCQAPGGSMDINATSTAANGARSFWTTIAPAGLQIDDASASSMSITALNYAGDSYGGGFFWGPDGSDGVVAAYPQSSAQFGIAQGTTGFPSGEFGFQMVCSASSCPNNGQSFYIGSIQLTVGETQGPSITAGGLWDQTGWVRGAWPISVGGDSPSGVCSLAASINGLAAVSAAASTAPNQTVWHQCAGSLAGSLNTALAPNGADSLGVSDGDAAGLSASANKTVDIDNQTPTVSLSGPSTASSTAGTQEVAVSVGAGPSGAYGANCSVDGGPSSFYAGASSQVAVSGLGEHTVTCTGMSNAVSTAGVRATSAPESFSLDIQQPTEEAISFSKIADAVHCARVTRRVKVLGKAHIVRLHGHPVSVRRVRYVKRRVRRCFAATVRRRVLVALRRHGKVVRRHGHVVRVRRVQRVVVVPHRVYRTVREIRHGRGTTVSGLLLLSDGTPLAGQPVTILGAPNIGTGLQFAAVSTAVTNADGYWVAKVSAGPSRILEAQYGGTSTTAPASSETVKLRVPARLAILSHTEQVAWGQTVRFTGQLYGGYIPPGGVNIELRYGYGRAWTTYGVKTHVGGDGRFRTAFTFGPGDPRDHLRFHFEFETLPGGAYPWAPAASNIADVEVGGHPRAHRQRRTGHQRKHRR